MSKSRANELLQELHTNLTANWTGKARFSSSDAIKMCREQDGQTAEVQEYRR